MKNYVQNDIVQRQDGVWTFRENQSFAYSDGIASEQYLDKVLSTVSDLGSESLELESWIKDWPSEYHLTRKRSQLLRGFRFDKSSSVLEVGCGCGSITRFLAENFDHVFAIEGSITRAGLAAKRTRGLDNVEILSAPFQDVKFNKTFDIIFCIGVFEYANAFVEGKDPYEVILEYFKDYLSDDGELVIAIENQFGIKYFASSTEDHTGIMFDGIEGYPRFGRKAKTFGLGEIRKRLLYHFRYVDTYFPYPDYKLPDLVLNEKFIESKGAGELVGKFPSRDYMFRKKTLFDEKLALVELDKNGQLGFFSNSFLLIARKSEKSSISFDQMGVMYNLDRDFKYRTITKFIGNSEGGSVKVSKSLLAENDVKATKGRLQFVGGEEEWVSGLTLQMQILKRIKLRGVSLENIFLPCRDWVECLFELSEFRSNEYYLPGNYLDAIWQNTVLDKNSCYFIDQEWKWQDQIPLKIMVIRAIYRCLQEIRLSSDVNGKLKFKTTRKLIIQISESLGFSLQKSDFEDFLEFEVEVQNVSSGKSKPAIRRHLNCVLASNYVMLFFTIKWSRDINFFAEKLVRIIGKVVHRNSKKVSD